MRERIVFWILNFFLGGDVRAAIEAVESPEFLEHIEETARQLGLETVSS